MASNHRAMKLYRVADLVRAHAKRPDLLSLPEQSLAADLDNNPLQLPLCDIERIRVSFSRDRCDENVIAVAAAGARNQRRSPSRRDGRAQQTHFSDLAGLLSLAGGGAIAELAV